MIMGWFSLFCYYNLYKGLECRLRVSEVLFPFFFTDAVAVDRVDAWRGGVVKI